MDVLTNGLPQVSLTQGELLGIVSELTPREFHASEVSNELYHTGEKYDIYIKPVSERRGIWIKLTLEDDGTLRIFKVHWTKIKKAKRS